MNLIVTVYGSGAFKRYLLPAVNDADHSILLQERTFDIPVSISLKLENLSGEWRFVRSDEYQLLLPDGRDVIEGCPVLEDFVRSDYASIMLVVRGRHLLSLIVRSAQNLFSSYERFWIDPNAGEVTIGRGRSNDITYRPQGENYLSSQHAAISHIGGVYTVRDLGSSNGSFVNGRLVTKPTELKPGDCLDLFGLRIVCLGDIIAINSLESGAIISSRTLKRLNPYENALYDKDRARRDKVVHRAPREREQVDTEGVKIEAPPNAKDSGEHTTILGAIGSALGMALPMALGCAFMFFASKAGGGMSNPFMFMGLITVAASAVIGVIRSVLGIRKARREKREYERLRNERYGTYLANRENEIKRKYENNARILRERNIDAKKVCAWSTDEVRLWANNPTQDDFLTHRLGMGDVEFQVPVSVPDERFTLKDDILGDLPQRIRENYGILRNVPVCVDLLRERLIGVVGGAGRIGAVQVTRDLIAQIAATNSYTEVKLIVVTDGVDYEEGDWDFAKWLPHVWDQAFTFRFIATNKEEATDVFFELNKILRQRMDENSGVATRNVIPIPHYVLVLGSPELMEGEAVAKSVLSPASCLGLTTIYLAERFSDLPNECEFVIENDRNFQGVWRTSDTQNSRVAIRFDGATVDDLRRQATELADARVREVLSGGEIPQIVAFFDLYGIQQPIELDVSTRWRKNRTYDSLAAIVGIGSGGNPCVLDIHEKYHGPHGLVAGTTGSGKSELLQTFILSMAINYSPDDVSFFIIDYKGGGMAGLLEGLPHLVGNLSNLSGNQVRRALVSIQSEKNRREAIFTEYGIKDIRDYTKLVKSGEANVPVPHLIIVIDEFAEMKHDEPEFIEEVVSISRVGRSLGIHLIMATQRPAGAVSEDIWANSRFKLCLRVQSQQDSNDMLHKPDAAYLTQTGRCYLQVGNDEVYEQFQSGYSGAVWVEDELDANADVATMLSANGMPVLVGSHAKIQRQRERKRDWVITLLGCVRELGIRDASELAMASRDELLRLADTMYDLLETRGIEYQRSDFATVALVTLLEQIGIHGFDIDKIIAVGESSGNSIRLPQRPEHTQLEAIVSHLRTCAQIGGYTRNYDLFLPLLPMKLPLESIEKSAGAPSRLVLGDDVQLSVALGLFDDPANQRQDAYSIDLLRDGNTLVLGGPQTGKSTFMQVFIHQLMMGYGPEEVWVYAVQYSARKFSPLEGAPQMGGVVTDEDGTDRLDKLMNHLSRMLRTRRAQLKDLSFSQHLKANGRGSLPAIVLVLDNYAAFQQRATDAHLSFMRTLLREGAGFGIFCIASAAGVGSGEVPNSMAQNFRTVICFELPNEYDYAAYLRVPRLRLRPESGVPGRGIAQVGGRILEFQTALPADLIDEARAAMRLGDRVHELSRRWRTGRADSIPSIPEKPTTSAFLALPSVQQMIGAGNTLPLGYDVRLAEPFGIDLVTTYSFGITGAKKKGKTNVLLHLVHMALEQGSEVVLADFDGDCRDFVNGLDITYLADEEAFSGYMIEFMPTVVERNKAKQAFVQKGLDAKEVYHEMCSFKRICFFVDGLPTFIERTYRPKVTLEKTYDSFLETVIEKCTLHNFYWFYTLDRADQMSVQSKKLFREFTRDHKGVHLGGQVHTTAPQGFNFESHDRRGANNARPLGRGMLPDEDETAVREVVIPLVERRRF